MLKSHMDAIEEHLLAISRIPANAGHSLHKGTPREAFIKEFLENHLSSTVSIGTGEIIDANSKPDQQRNQFDIVVYKNNYPKIDFGGGISGFLAESVVATIEVKSTLDSDAIVQSCNAAIKAKALEQNVSKSFSTGYIPPSILNYVIAYNGPASIKTAYGWLNDYHIERGIKIQADESNRLYTPSPSLDGIFVLGKGSIQFDNMPISLINEANRENNLEKYWVLADTTSGNILNFFIVLLEATNNVQGFWLNPLPYLNNCHFDNIEFI